MSKSGDVQELFECLKTVYEGGTYIENALQLPIIKFSSETQSLTKREKQVAELLLEDKSNSEISSVLNIKKRTVENCVSIIYDKLGCSNREEFLKKISV